MIPVFFTARARRYVQSSPSTKNLPKFNKDRLIKGIAKLISESFQAGFKQGTAQK